ncbi:glycosyltransferase family 4 protein [Aliifodinibius sp. S!AR15-10]|uniref:glycosyltransferase family 4 protein n=1 Tax=Aliifodinibius sp. S!AR15-10 TaxID=2950437 RepID=UPI0028677AEB|nr:glycosyltransferase family 1 protein [Aliifodinibius sp. S!AR15-10]MDR8392619.1 glycosyltransferase family 4 protein [Aliifodinibius sp. S!AR15-10]
MRKLYINGHFLQQQLAGVQRYAREVIKGFDRGGYPYQIVEPTGFFASNRLGRNLWQQVVLPTKINSEHTLWSPANNGPVYSNNHVITLHDIAVFPHPEWFSASYAIWKRTLIPRIARRATGILTVSEFSKSIICKHLDIAPQKIKVVYNGVDSDRFTHAVPSAVKHVRSKYNLQSPYVLTLGSLDPRKNFKRTVEAWRLCKEQDKLPNFDLVIAGGSNANFRNLDLDLSDESIKVLGYVDDEDLPALYSGAEAFVLPSLFEGFGLPIVEAMACGTPVITSNTTALDEIAGDAAVKVDPSDTTSISEGILELLNAPALKDRLKVLGTQRAREFSWDKSAKEIYDYLVEG